MRIPYDYYLVGLIGSIFEEKKGAIHLPSRSELTLAGKTKEEIFQDEQRVLSEIRRIMISEKKLIDKKKKMHPFLESVGWEMFKDNGKLAFRRKQDEIGKEAHGVGKLKNHGVLLSIPIEISDTFVHNEEIGFPEPTRYINPGAIDGTLTYRCVSYEPKKKRLCDIYTTKFKDCHTLYFFIDHIANDNYVHTRHEVLQDGSTRKNFVYKVCVDGIICGINKEGKIDMNDNMLLVKPTVVPRQKSKSILVAYESKRPPWVAEVIHGIYAGKSILFEEGCSVEVEVEGEKYHALPLSLVTCLVEDFKPIPLPKHILVKPEPVQEKTRLGVAIPKNLRKYSYKADVVLMGEGCSEVNLGETIIFGKGCGIPISDKENDMLIVKESDVVAVF